MTENEMKKYIEENFWDMSPIEEKEIFFVDVEEE